MNTASDAVVINLADLKTQMDDNGFVHVRNLFDAGEVAEITNAFEVIHREGVPGFYEPEAALADRDAPDPLKQWPRVMHPHRFNACARRYMLHGRVRACLAAFFGHDPVATQSMYYFKPPGSRGQALHQDNFYLMVQPGTCMAAWTAIDDCDRENGAMMVVPGSHREEVVCPEEADDRVSFTKEFVRVPPGRRARLVEMKAGDTLFFNGSLIHGSGPNRSTQRFRRSFICHYASGAAERISHHYNPLVRMDGSEIELPKAIGGGPCGTEWEGAVH